MTWWQGRRELFHLVIPAALIAGAWAARWLSGPELFYSLPMTAAAVYAGVPIVQEAWLRLRHKQFSIPLLITVASAGALWIGEVWEAAAVTFLYRFGGYLESLTLNRTRAALRELLDLRPVTARVRREDGEWREVPADEVRVGEIVLVRPGEKVPVDGTAVGGPAALDIAALIGDGSVGSDGKELAFGIPGYERGTVDETRHLKLETFDAKTAQDCSLWFDNPPQGFALSLTDEGGSLTLHRDETLPRSRGCVFDYRLYAVLLPGLDAPRDRGVVIVSVYPGGFEGPDRRFLAVPLAL